MIRELPAKIMTPLGAALALLVWIPGWARVDPDFYEPIPTGRNYRLSPGAIKHLVDTDDVHGMRRHAWHIFSQLIKPSRQRKDIARWETWYDVDETFAIDPGPPSGRIPFRRRLEAAPEVESLCPEPGTPPARQFNPAAFVLYNREAYKHIRDNRLYLRKILDSMQGEVAPFPATAIVLKTNWALVSKAKGNPKGVWDFERPFPGGVRNPAANWPRQVCVAEDLSKCTVKDQTAVPVSSFYNFRIDKERLGSLIKLDQFKEAQEGDYAILLGFHFATREQEDWVWATFWWHDHPKQGVYADDRPGHIPKPWSNYLMTTAYDMDKPREPDGRPRIAYNPYLEGSVDDGVTSNCMSCHRRATLAPDGNPTLDVLASDGSIRSSGLAGIVVRGIQAASATYLNTPLEQRLKLSFLWSLAFHARGEDGVSNASPHAKATCTEKDQKLQ